MAMAPGSDLCIFPYSSVSYLSPCKGGVFMGPLKNLRREREREINREGSVIS
jgi:hypothetical protein